MCFCMVSDDVLAFHLGRVPASSLGQTLDPPQPWLVHFTDLKTKQMLEFVTLYKDTRVWGLLLLLWLN